MDIQANIRPMRKEEKKEVSRLMRRCFNWFARLIFSFGKETYVYGVDGVILGAVTISCFSLGPRRRGGIVQFVFVHPKARGQGVAAGLLQRSMEWFAGQGCTDVFATVEGYNTPSSNRFARLGFELNPFAGQVREFGRRLPRLWLKTLHLADIGYFLWHRRTGDTPAPQAVGRVRNSGFRQLGAWCTTLGLHILIFLMGFLRWGRELDTAAVIQVSVIAAAVIGLRTLAMYAAGRSRGLDLEYRSWESGIFFSSLITLVFGGILFAPGALYPRRREWSYRRLIPQLGPAAFAGTAGVLVLGWALQLIPGIRGDLPQNGLLFIRFFLLFEVLLPVFPFSAFNGRLILDWCRPLWAAAALGTLGLWFLGLF